MNQNEIKKLTTNPAKDLLPINKDQIFKSEDMKKCIKCNIEKSVSEFYIAKESKDGLFSSCKECESKYKIKHRKTLNGCLRAILDHSKSNAKKRKEKGRIDSGICDITFSDLEEQWKKQDGKCYYSNIPMNYNKRDWKVSLERLNENKGYMKDNIVLCCQEFNSSSQWSKEKIKEMIEILNEDIIRHTFSFDLEETKHNKKKRIIETIMNDVKYYKCTKCDENKTRDMFTKKLSDGCKSCMSFFNKKRNNSPRGSLNTIIHNAKNSTKTRSKVNNIKRDNSFDIDFDYLVEIYNKQKGLCAYSKLPLQFGNSKKENWICSIERIDVLKGYVKGNVCLICVEFNVSDKTIIYKNKEEGNSGWNKEKFKYFLEHVRN